MSYFIYKYYSVIFANCELFELKYNFFYQAIVSDHFWFIQFWNLTFVLVLLSSNNYLSIVIYNYFKIDPLQKLIDLFNFNLVKVYY